MKNMNSNTTAAPNPQVASANEETVNDILNDEEAIGEILRESIELRHKADILASVPDLIAAFDAAGHIHFASQSVLDFLGLDKASDIEGRSFWDLFTNKSRADIKAAFEDALAREVKEGEDSIFLADGMIMPVHLVTRDGQGRQEVHRASFKGTACLNSDVPECVCSLQLVANVDMQSKQQNGGDVVVSDNQEGKAKSNFGSWKRIAAPSNTPGAKRVRIDDASFNQVSDESVSKNL